MKKSKPTALEAYEVLADGYAATAETDPRNINFERPATLSLLPRVEGQRVLDAGCGPGIYSAWLIERGAEVVAVDASPRMIELASQRLGGLADIRRANLEAPLDFLDSSSFDIVLSFLVLDHLKDWRNPLAEFYRLLRPAGYLIISVSHPFFDYSFYRTSDYFATELVGCGWPNEGHEKVFMPSYRRPLSAVLNPIMEIGFSLEKVLEPQPTLELKDIDPKGFADLSKRPSFMCIRARKGTNDWANDVSLKTRRANEKDKTTKIGKKARQGSAQGPQEISSRGKQGRAAKD